MSNYRELCEEILKDVGGKDNITYATHCMTRLRLNVKDQGKIETGKIEKIKGVIGCQFSGGQFQIIIGQHVNQVYQEFVDLAGLQNNAPAEPEKKKMTWKDIPNRVIDAVSGCVTPILPIITATGIIKLLYALLGPSMLNWLPAESDFMQLLNFVGDAGFYFFPIYVGWSASRKFKTSTPLALFLCAILLHPSLQAIVEAGESFSVYGIPMALVNYSSQFLPSILIVWILSYVYGFFDRHVPNSVKILLVPTCTLLVMLPIALCVLGPIAYWMGQLLASFFTGLYNIAGPVAIALVGALWYFLVATGMHQALIAIAITMISTVGSESIILVGGACSSFALYGMAIAYLLRCRKEDKAMASANAVTLIVGGISEPTIFSVLLRYKSAMVAELIGGFVGGLLAGLMGVKVYFMGATNILTILGFSKDIAMASIACAAAFVISLVLGLMLGFNENSGKLSFRKKKEEKSSDADICAPVDGRVIPLEKVQDPAFASKAMGDGIAIVPSSGTVRAPFDGKVVALFPTGHAIGLQNDKGQEVLIHIGLDTVNDQGQSFHPKAAVGDTVRKGQELISFDLEDLQKKGYDLTTPVIITEGELKDKESGEKTVKSGDPILRLA